ncbi:hypothetical protein [Actinacidiphila rubida]|uniref:hypothetical protein n=1 Tax=Actinacidiphila rubida TaxID=310780 RepID=UPI00114CC29B|nr:hypothetical protein [Actinacidiphila rubida]
MSRISELWREYLAPGWDGMYRADGSARQAEVDGDDLSWFELGPSFDVDALLEEDPENLNDVGPDPRTVVELPDGSGYVCGGESSMGGDGFFARLDPEQNVVWLVFLSNSNPFVRVAVEGSMVTFVNNRDRSLVIDLNDPDFAL